MPFLPRWLTSRGTASFYLCLIAVGLALFWYQDRDQREFRTAMSAYEQGDTDAALARWQSLAEQGHQKAQFNLGVLYERGERVDQDLVRAADWYRRAAESGLAAAQVNIGLMHLEGRGTTQDAALAAGWHILFRPLRKAR